MKLSQVPVGAVVVVGLPFYLRPAVKFTSEGWTGWGQFRWLDDGELVDPDDFKGGWDEFVPEGYRPQFKTELPSSGSPTPMQELAARVRLQRQARSAR